jgi:hypothetical protein
MKVPDNEELYFDNNNPNIEENKQELIDFNNKKI